MSECGVLAEHSTVSYHRFVPTAIMVPNRGDPGREIGQTRTDAAPVSTARRGNGALVRVFTVIASLRRSLSSPGALTPTSTPKDTGNSRHDPPGMCRTSACAVHPRRLAVDRPDNP